MKKKAPGGIKFITEARNKLGFTRYKLAKTLGLGWNTLTWIEKKAADCSCKTMVRILVLAGYSDAEIGRLLRAHAAKND